eukprot:364569-Chlamydomonas_euryale.AAC.11
MPDLKRMPMPRGRCVEFGPEGGRCAEFGLTEVAECGLTSSAWPCHTCACGAAGAAVHELTCSSAATAPPALPPPRAQQPALGCPSSHGHLASAKEQHAPSSSPSSFWLCLPRHARGSWSLVGAAARRAGAASPLLLPPPPSTPLLPTPLAPLQALLESLSYSRSRCRATSVLTYSPAYSHTKLPRATVCVAITAQPFPDVLTSWTAAHRPRCVPRNGQAKAAAAHAHAGPHSCAGCRRRRRLRHWSIA